MRHAFANVEFDEMSATLRIDGRDVDIEPRPLAVLAELLRRPNEVVTKEEMLDAVWAGKPTVEHVLANAVSKLRTVLGPAGAARIVTVHRLGYRFVGPMHQIEPAGTPLTAEPGMVVPGREGFVLERRLSGGGQSEVWLATHAKLDQKRVFKFASNALQLSALQREYTLYRVLSKTLGPRDDIAVVVDANFARPPFFIECLYAGPNLVEWGVRDGHLKCMTFQERLALFLQIAQAVSTAHSVGVLHKDLEPTNVLIEGAPGRWQIRLTDFGSGRMLDWSQLDALQVTAHGLTLKTADGSVGQLSGTPLYVAPELLAGHAPTVQSDLYALGVLLFQILSVKLRQPLTTGWQRRIDDPLLQQVIAEATESMPEDRIGSVRELILRLQRLDIRRVEQARRTEQDAAAAQAVAKAQRARLRRPWIAAAMAALTVGLSLSLWSQGRTKDALRSAELAGVQMRAVNDFLTKDVLASIDLAMAGGRRTLTMLDVMRRAASHVGERLAGQPRTEAAVRTHLARMFQRMVSTTDADVQYVAALSALQPVTASDDVQALAIRFERVRLRS